MTQCKNYYNHHCDAYCGSQGCRRIWRDNPIVDRVLAKFKLAVERNADWWMYA